jgi:predicted enzyme related to lactoylglutathione lyase
MSWSNFSIWTELSFFYNYTAGKAHTFAANIFKMNNLINWFEIPATDFSRAVNFYKSILDIEIPETEMFEMQMGLFPSDGQNVSGAIVKGDTYKPSADGVTMYLNGGEDLSVILGRVENAGGTIIVPKTQINPETGYMAMFIDTEGNKMALHSIK